SGSLTTQDSGMALRYAAAEARALCLDEAARRLAVPAASLTVADGEIRSPSGARTSYWEVGEASASVAPKAASAHRLIGRPAERIDLPDKVFGRARYVHDMVLPGLLHGRVLRPPSPAATLVALDEAAVRAMPGVAAVVKDGSFVGVVAEREAIARAALERLRKDARWNEPATLPDEGNLGQWLRAARHETSTVIERGAPAAASVR